MRRWAEVAALALTENERSYPRLEALGKENASLRGERAPEQLEIELLRVKEQMMALQRRMFAASSEKRARDHDVAPRAPEPPLGRREHRMLPTEECVHERRDEDYAAGHSRVSRMRPELVPAHPERPFDLTRCSTCTASEAGPMSTGRHSPAAPIPATKGVPITDAFALPGR